MTTQAYGNWKSPLTSELVAGQVQGIPDVLHDAQSGIEYHVASVPPSGAFILYETRSGTQVTPQGSNTRTRCNEYGGASAAVLGNRALMSDFTSNTVYQRTRSEDDSWSEAKKVVPNNKSLRYADFALHPQHKHLSVAVQEDHTVDEPSQVANRLVVINDTTSEAHVVAEGAGFYSNPRFDASGDRLLWLQWDLPYMPWERTILQAATFSAQGDSPPTLVDVKVVEGSMQEHASIAQPQWVGQNIVALSDERGFNEPWFFRVQDDFSEPLLAQPPKRDFGFPSWVFGMQHWTVLSESSVVAASGAFQLSVFSGLGTSSLSEQKIEVPYSSVESIRAMSSSELLVKAASANKMAQVVKITLKDGKATCDILKDTTPVAMDTGYISEPRQITYSTTDTNAYAYFYPPKNMDFVAPEGTKPPLLVVAHGGPTAQASATLNYGRQWWTSRGWAIVDVDYRGSTGFGKAYRDRLNGAWGVADTEDVANCVRHLVKDGLVDSHQVAIAGGSAGGFTVLNALCDFSRDFNAGASLYGVADLQALLEGTHKFESEYLFGLLGGRPEEVPKHYHDRAPINKVNQIIAPLLVLQGDQDKIVPVDQAETIVNAVKKNGQRVDYILFEGEGHGFRQTHNVIAALEKQHSFFCETFGIRL